MIADASARFYEYTPLVLRTPSMPALHKPKPAGMAALPTFECDNNNLLLLA